MYMAMMAQPASDYLDAMTEQTMQGMTRESIVAQMSDSYAAQMGVSRDEVVNYIEKMDDETLFSYVCLLYTSAHRPSRGSPRR